MKAALRLLAAFLLLTSAAHAQDAAPSPPETPPQDPGTPSNQRLELIPDQRPVLEAPRPAEDLPLIPETPEPTAKPATRAIPEAKGEKKSQTEIAAGELQQRIRLRQLKTRASRDPAVMADLERANAARTDFEKREAMRSYYQRLFGRMAKLDGSLKKRINEQQQRALRELEQTRVDPTEPLDPQERAERAER